MQLVLIGCEYSGTTTLARSVFDWINANLDGGMPFFHDHWKLPFTSGHQEHDLPLAPTEEEQEQVLALSPKLKEMYNRYSLYYHARPSSFRRADYVAVGLHIEESIYGPLYWGYGIKGPWPVGVERSVVQGLVEKELLLHAPDMVLALVKASPDVIRRRMAEDPHPHQVVPEEDIETVSARFEEEFERSAIANKLTVDTSTDTVEQSLASLLEQFDPFLNDADKLRIVVKKMKDGGEWPLLGS